MTRIEDFMGIRIVINDLCVRHNFTINARLAELMPPGWGEDLQAWCDEKFGVSDMIYYMPDSDTAVMSSKYFGLIHRANGWSEL